MSLGDPSEQVARIRIQLCGRFVVRIGGDRALERLGNVAEALRVYETLRTRLRDELGVAPSTQAQTLHTRLLRGDPATANDTLHTPP